MLVNLFLISHTNFHLKPFNIVYFKLSWQNGEAHAMLFLWAWHTNVNNKRRAFEVTRSATGIAQIC